MRFATYHPVIVCFYFLIVTIFICVFQHPAYLLISFLFSFIYSMYYRRDALGYLKEGVFLHGILRLFGSIMFSVMFTFYYVYGHHFGMTNLLKTNSGNYITLETLAYGTSIGIRVCSLYLWLSCFLYIFTTDKITYLLGRIHPKLSLYIAIGLRLGPRTIDKGKKINEAQNTIGLGVRQGNGVARVRHLVRLSSVLVSWTAEQWKESGESMRSRGYTLKGRTSFAIYRFDNRDRILLVWLVLLITIVCVGASLDQNTIVYNPTIFMQRTTIVSGIFYATYGIIFMLPFCVEILSSMK